MLNAGSLCGPCGIRFHIELMQMIRLDKVVLEKSLDDSIQETLIHHYFGGCLQSQVKCIQCLHESNGYEPMMDLLVDIQGNVKSVEDALAQFTDTELLDGANKYKCDQYVLLMCSGNIGGCFHVYLQSQEIE
jgi:ubiquitin carboxyl-terminal hydrolase 36/42